jgi:PAS domain S-box-containing protein
MVQHVAEKFLRPPMGSRRRFLDISRQVSATIGNGFFSELATQLSRALSADCLYIGEFSAGPEESIRTIVLSLDGKAVETCEFALAGTPDGGVALGSLVYPSGVQRLFPTDRRLREWGAEAYVAQALNDSEGRPAGLIAVLYRRPLGEEVPFVQSMLAMFAVRVAAELNRKRADDALRESEQRHRAFIELNPTAMWRVEFGQPIAIDLPEKQQLESMRQLGYVAECNDSAARLVGRERAELLIGLTVAEFALANGESVYNSQLHLVRSGYQFSTVEITNVDCDGNLRYLLVSHWGIVENGALRRIWGMAQDVTESRQSQLALAASEKRIAEILETTKLVAIKLDRDGSLSFCNDYFLQLTGWKAKDIIGKNWFDLVAAPHERERHRAVFASAPFSSQTSHHVEGTLTGSDGRNHVIEWHYEILRDSAGGIAGAAGVGCDITEKKELETRLGQYQKLETIGKLAGGVAHDFNNLLTVIRGYSAHLLERRDPSDPAYVGLVEIKKAAEKGATLTHQLLAFSRRQAAKPQLLDLSELVTDDQDMLRRLIGENIVFTTNVSPSLGSVYADAGQMHQVILNLVVNARDAMPKGGELIIGLSNVEIVKDRDPRLSEMKPGRYVQLLVSDSGVGMSEFVRDQIFEPFFTTKGPGDGTGLGLSTVYGIVRQSNGCILVDTKPGKGTTFRIFLPRVNELEPVLVGAEPAPAIRGGTETILLVEDQQEVRDILCTLLRHLGYTVLEAKSGDEALKRIKRRKAIDLVVTDLVMPGMSGDQLAERIRSVHNKIRVIYMTGYCDVPQQPEAAIYRKSLPFEALASLIREVLDQTRTVSQSVQKD